MKKTLMIVAAGVLATAGLKAQTIQEGMNHLYADRFKSATSVFEKLLAANPNNTEATYWLGQTYLDEDKNDLARQLYDKALATSNNAPLLLVGRGHIDLLDKKLADARQKFETAITMTNTKKGGDPAILNAVGRANVDAKEGDFKYAVEKLELAAQRDDKNPDVHLNLGNAYRKAGQGSGGGQAFTSYKRALELNPNFAVSYLRLAKLFEAQRNGEQMLQYLNQAVQVDAKFTAAYYELFYYYFYRSKFDDAESYLKKYMESKLPVTDTQDEFLYAQLCWARKDFNCAITKAEGVMTANGALTKPKVLKLLADAYNQRGDSINAKKYIDLYFAKEKADEVIGFDHALKAEIYIKFPGQEDVAYASVLEGVRIDTTVDGKVKILTDWTEKFKDRGRRDREGELFAKIIEVKPKPNLNDYFYPARTFYFAKKYDRSLEFSRMMVEKFPEEVYGYEWSFNGALAIDTVKKDSLAVPAALKLYEFAQKDTTKYKKHILSTSRYLAGYYNNDAKDKEKALEYLRKWQSVDAANAVTIQSYIDALQKTPAAKPQRGGTKPVPATKPKTTAKAIKK